MLLVTKSLAVKVLGSPPKLPPNRMKQSPQKARLHHTLLPIALTPSFAPPLLPKSRPHPFIADLGGKPTVKGAFTAGVCCQPAAKVFFEIFY